jgi:hypothetical protein
MLKQSLLYVLEMMRIQRIMLKCDKNSNVHPLNLIEILLSCEIKQSWLKSSAKICITISSDVVARSAQIFVDLNAKLFWWKSILIEQPRGFLAEFLFHLSLMKKPLFVYSNIDFPLFVCWQEKNFIQYLSAFSDTIFVKQYTRACA